MKDPKEILSLNELAELIQKKYPDGSETQQRFFFAMLYSPGTVADKLGVSIIRNASRPFRSTSEARLIPSYLASWVLSIKMSSVGLRESYPGSYIQNQRLVDQMHR